MQNNRDTRRKEGRKEGSDTNIMHSWGGVPFLASIFVLCVEGGGGGTADRGEEESGGRSRRGC